jgi:glutamyl-tRNA synthetase
MPSEKEKFTLDEFIKNFDLDRVDPAGPVFDQQKLEWLNGEWIRSLKNKDLAERLKEYSKTTSSEVEKVLPLVQNRLKKLSEFDSLTHYFFKDRVDIDPNQAIPKGHDSAATVVMLQNVEESLSKVERWEKDAIEKTLNEKSNELGWTRTNLFQTTRYIQTGSRATPPLHETLEVIGKQKTLARFKNATKILSQQT